MVHNCNVELDSAYLTRIARLPCCPQRCTRYTRGKRVRPAGRRLGTARGCTAGCGSSSQASPGARFVCCRKSEGTQVKVELSISQWRKIRYLSGNIFAKLLKIDPPVPQGRDFLSPPGGGWLWPGELRPLTFCVVRRRTKMKRNKNHSVGFKCFSLPSYVLFILFSCITQTHQQYVSHDGPVQGNQRFTQSHENLQCMMQIP